MSGKNLKELAEMIKGKSNQSIGITTGDVISTSPMRIHYGDKIILESRHLIFAGSLIDGYEVEYTDTTDSGAITRTIIVKNELETGDKVIMIPDINMNKWFVIDKAVSQ